MTGGVIAPPHSLWRLLTTPKLVHLDVTSIVETWRTGAANNGLYVGARAEASTNGWQIFTSGATDPSFRPALRIVGVRIPEPTAAMLMILGATLTASLVRRRR